MEIALGSGKITKVGEAIGGCVSEGIGILVGRGIVAMVAGRVEVLDKEGEDGVILTRVD
jgi:hypothetical protein